MYRLSTGGRLAAPFICHIDTSMAHIATCTPLSSFLAYFPEKIIRHNNYEFMLASLLTCLLGGEGDDCWPHAPLEFSGLLYILSLLVTKSTSPALQGSNNIANNIIQV